MARTQPHLSAIGIRIVMHPYAGVERVSNPSRDTDDLHPYTGVKGVYSPLVLPPGLFILFQRGERISGCPQRRRAYKGNPHSHPKERGL